MRVFVLLAVFFITSCETNNIAKQVRPENLLSSNVEDVSFTISGSESVDSMFEWIIDDKPNSALLSCASGDSLCIGAERVLSDLSVPYRMDVVPGEESSVSLVYNRLLTRDCSNGLGCAMSTNMIGAITNQSDFTNPALSDYHDAQKAVENYNNYYSR